MKFFSSLLFFLIALLAFSGCRKQWPERDPWCFVTYPCAVDDISPCRRLSEIPADSLSGLLVGTWREVVRRGGFGIDPDALDDRVENGCSIRPDSAAYFTFTANGEFSLRRGDNVDFQTTYSIDSAVSGSKVIVYAEEPPIPFRIDALCGQDTLYRNNSCFDGLYQIHLRE